MKGFFIFPFIVVVVIVLITLLHETESFSTLWITKRCCNMGSFSKTCEDFRAPVQVRTPEDIKYCDAIFHDCCTSKKQNTSCSYGIQAAEAGRECNLYVVDQYGSSNNRDNHERDGTFTACCHMCKLGLNSPTCYKANVANISDQAFVDCCSKPREGIKHIDSHHTHPLTTLDSCPSGYHSIEGKCVNINECVTGQHLCRSDEACVDSDGSYYCEAVCAEGYKPQNGNCVLKTLCDSGFTFDSNQDDCVNINECLNKTACSKGFACRDLLGSFECVEDTCPSGKKMTFESTDKVSCVDLDECQDNQHDCDLYVRHEICRNLDPGFECICAPGFMRNESSHRCVDINECREGTFCESGISVCVNTIGSFFCQCKERFSGDPRGKCISGLIMRDSSGFTRMTGYLTSSSRERYSTFTAQFSLLTITIVFGKTILECIF